MYPLTTQKLILENPIGLEDYGQMVPYQTVDKWYKSKLALDYDKIKPQRPLLPTRRNQLATIN